MKTPTTVALALALHATILVGCARTPGPSPSTSRLPAAPPQAAAEPSAPQLTPTAVSSGNLDGAGTGSGNNHLFVLKPLPQGFTAPTTFSGTFDSAAGPQVDICELSGTRTGGASDKTRVCSTVQGAYHPPLVSNITGNPYRLKWDTRSSASITGGKDFRFRFLSKGLPIGFVDVGVYPKGQRPTGTALTRYNGFILVEQESTLDLQFRIEIGATAVAATDADTLEFGTVRLRGTNDTSPPTLTRTVTLSNAGNTELTGITLNVTGTNAGDFTLPATAPCTQPIVNSATATGGAVTSCGINVTFTPKAAGVRGASLVIQSRTPDAQKVVTLSGLGQSDVPPTPSNPPADGRLITVFPARSMVVLDKFPANQLVTVRVTHAAGAVGSNRTATVITNAAGFAEVNHPGGACWSGGTPFIQPGDTIEAATSVSIDQLTVADVNLTSLPVATLISDPTTTDPKLYDVDLRASVATALVNTATPGPAGLEVRIVDTSNTRFDKNQRRDLRASGDPAALDDEADLVRVGAIDGTHDKWVATFHNLDEHDVNLIMASTGIPRVMWLGTNPAAGNEVTIHEAGTGVTPEALAGCNAPFEGPSVTVSPVELSLLAPSSTSVASGTLTVQNTGGMPISLSLDGLTGSSTLKQTATTCNAKAPLDLKASCSIDVTFSPNNVAGPYLAFVTVNSQSPAGPQRVPVTGRVVAPPTADGKQLFLAPNTHNIFVFPGRSMVTAEKYQPGEVLTVQVFRNGSLKYKADNVIAGPDGTAEVNHPGGACWTSFTPYLLPGDQIRVLGSTSYEATTIQDVKLDLTSGGRATSRSGNTVTVTGTYDPALNPAALEVRIVDSSNTRFQVNGRRDLRAPGAGTLALTAPAFTGSFTLNTFDANLATADTAIARVAWLGTNPAAANEATLMEAGAGITRDPMPGCAATAPLDPPPTP
ncbi:choice-of-anchor D domain-containing protein [Deinococcus pimensis]|uniref:choice-of-anchor D domain-containing protein n=1 Tax=Deinococcus pimensis TaxID=309888 RepID=UPI0004AD8476|nr:choice-of-anchor D domain-containing protein [Deinococcus pimensis]